MAKQRVNGKLWIGKIVNGQFVPTRLPRRLAPGRIPIVPVPPREVPKRVVRPAPVARPVAPQVVVRPPQPRPQPVRRQVVPRVAQLPDGNYIIRKKGGGKDSTEAIVAKSQTRLGLLREDVQTRFQGRGCPQRIGFLFRWGFCGPTPPAQTIVNEAGAIGLTSNKTAFRRKMNEKELSPKSWFDPLDQTITYPCVVRPRSHEQGLNVHLCNSFQELQRAWGICGPGGYIAQYIDKKKEYRVFVVSGRVGWVAEKIPGPNPGVSWNHAQGSHFENRRFDAWPLRSCKAAVEAFNLSGLDFGAVDVMEDAKGKAYVLEINTAMALESEYRATCTAKCFDYLVTNGKGNIPLIERKGDWKKFAHPAVSGAVLVREEA